MYRVMIIDDEKSLRRLLRATVDWERLDLDIVGEAASGIEAINIIDELQPDIAFVDIRMPFMDGIEFSKMAIKRYPNLQIVILTAFEEFDYAKQCIGLGVIDYLLKPIVKEEIEQACVKAIEKIKEMPKVEIQDYKEESDMERVIDYIKKEYHDAEINLTSVAQKFGYNPSYLSRRFKAENGIGIIDFLTKIRMEQAIEHAKNNQYMYIAAEKVGIPDPNYFGKCFKKYTGTTYSDYSKNKQEV